MNEMNIDWMLQRRFDVFKRLNNRHCWFSRLIGVFISIEFVMSFVLLNQFFFSLSCFFRCRNLIRCGLLHKKIILRDCYRLKWNHFRSCVRSRLILHLKLLLATKKIIRSFYFFPSPTHERFRQHSFDQTTSATTTEYSITGNTTMSFMVCLCPRHFYESHENEMPFFLFQYSFASSSSFSAFQFQRIRYQW